MEDKTIKILAVETSCDETAAAVVENGRKILSNVIYTQISLHTVFGGVVPEIASRKHIEKINPVIEKALDDAGVTLADIDAVAVTYGPGLVGALLVGVAEAKAIAYAAGKPLVGVHHIEGHISANYIEHEDLTPPFLCLVASGGHSHLVMVRDYGEYEIIGRTRDDAAGEAFDKVAKMLGLGYPGGPIVDNRAKLGNPRAFDFPRPLCNTPGCDFSFSGIKTAARTFLDKTDESKRDEQFINDFCASFQSAVVDCIVNRLTHAFADERVVRAAPKTLVVAGGVAKNSAIRAAMSDLAQRHKMIFAAPPMNLCTDNGAMIAWAGLENYRIGKVVHEPVAPRPRWPLTEL